MALDTDGVLAGAKSGDIYIELSTISPEVVHTIARQAAEKGVAVLDAPVSGGLDQRREGSLTIMAGGNAKMSVWPMRWPKTCPCPYHLVPRPYNRFSPV